MFDHHDPICCHESAQHQLHFRLRKTRKIFSTPPRLFDRSNSTEQILSIAPELQDAIRRRSGSRSSREGSLNSASSSTPEGDGNSTFDPALLDELLFPGFRFTPEPGEVGGEEGFGYLPNSLEAEGGKVDAKTDGYESGISTKYVKNGIATTFKSGGELKLAKAKSLAKRDIDRVHRAMEQKESEVFRLEQELAQTRVLLTESLAEAKRTASEISTLSEATRKWEIEKNLPCQSALHKPRLRSNDHVFEMPSDPILNLDAGFRALRQKYMEHTEVAARASDLIPRLEEALMRLQHSLSTIQIQEEKLGPLEDKLLADDEERREELEVVARFKLRQVEERARRMGERAQRQEHRRRIKETAVNAETETLNQKLEEQRKQLRGRLKDTVDKMKAEQKDKVEQKMLARLRKETALGELRERTTAIRQAAITKTAPAGPRDADSPPPSDNRKDSLLIRHTKGLIRMRRDELLRKREIDDEKREERKMALLHGLIGEERARRLERRREKTQAWIRSILEHREYSERAFPPDVVRPPIDSLTLEKRRRKSLARPMFSDLPRSLLPSFENLAPDDSRSDSGSDDNIADDLEDEIGFDKAPDAEGASKTTKPGAAVSTTTAPSEKSRTRPPLPLPSRALLIGKSKSIKPLLSNCPPFLANPCEVVFRDYDPEKVYECRVVLTNTSCRVNTFRLLPIPVELASYFEVVLAPAGRMSAGTTCELKVVFRPPAGYDRDTLDGKVSFASEHGGTFTLSVGCTTRKCLPAVKGVGGPGVATWRSDAGEVSERGASDDCGSSTPWDDEALDGFRASRRGNVARMRGPRTVGVEFGKCMVGDQIVRFVEISNSGALPTEFEVVTLNPGDDPSSVTTPTPDSANVEVQEGSKTPTAVTPTRPSSISESYRILRNRSGELPPYGSQIIHIQFSPPYEVEPKGSDRRKAAGHAAEQRELCRYAVRFSRVGIEPLFIECRARATEAPMVAGRDRVDFGLCVFGSIFREVAKQGPHRIEEQAQYSPQILG
ncbi:hypothetical protein BDK51DRAFT_30915 [Blyttiomyces helicus]|uniref:Uncharacterized protein n=1 Tax=Blyttiomyces helicus TaxID=388810 RepID=A0A4V1IRW5_9FUNG|nr:hypothetical protein BDK51DRAFT_30915 [Blyttiomyces helicus]|eukprot:RKO91477.1 hypothetical protein BDK51DRAFT_30915 [Blyttiomyces helicus]